MCFDVDSTVIKEEGIDELAKFCGVGDAVTEMYVTKHQSVVLDFIINLRFLKYINMQLSTITFKDTQSNGWFNDL